MTISASSTISYLNQTGEDASVTLISPSPPPYTTITAATFTIGNYSTLSGSGIVTGNVTNYGNVVVGTLDGTTEGYLSFTNYFQSETGSMYFGMILLTRHDKSHTNRII
jgi:hypothetical protein